MTGSGNEGYPPSRVRRRTLALLGAGVAAPLAGACRPPEPLDRRVRLPLSRLPAGERIQVTYDGAPVEVCRTESGVVARSLLCTHFGCRVHWEPDRERYVCACHGGEFDGEGRPVAGPPSRPLGLLAVEQTGDAIVVGEP